MSYEDQTLSPVVLSEETGEGAGPLHIRVALPKACIGPCEITARYALTSSAGTADGTIRVPLIMPLVAELAGNNVFVTPGADQQVEVASGVWRAVEGGLGPAAPPRTLELAATERTGEILLRLHGQSGRDSAVVVDRAWFQTCVTRAATGAREDRAVLQLTTRRHELEITLPEGAARDQASVQLNGIPVNPLARAERVLIVPLTADVEPPRFVLSLQYHFPGPRPSWGVIKFDFPSLGEETWIRHAYWQLLLPPEEHLVVSPAQLTGEFVWGWNHFYFGRQPVLSQTDLELWAGLGPTGSSPAPAGMNAYLFSSLGRIGPCEVVTMGRSTIVFVSSGIALLIGLLLIYVKAARHPIVLLVAAAILAGLTATDPELALMAAQASAVGLALVLLAVFLRQLTAGSRQPLLTEASSIAAPILPQPRPSEPAVPIVVSSSSHQTAIVSMPPDAAT